MTCIEAEMQEVFKKKGFVVLKIEDKDTIWETITSSLKKLIPEDNIAMGSHCQIKRHFLIVLGPTVGLFNLEALG